MAATATPLQRQSHQECYVLTFSNSRYQALIKLFLLKDKTLETLLVIGYNPSHLNINSDVWAPFKILSLLIRCLDNEVTS